MAPSELTRNQSQRQSWRRWSTPLALGVALLGALAVGYVIWAVPGKSVGWGLDYLAYHNAALRLATTGTPYQPETLLQAFFPGAPGLYLYSPMLAALLVPIASLGTGASIAAWVGLQVVALAMACALMPVSRSVRLAVFGVTCLSWPFLFDIKLGNVNTFVALLGVVAWRWLDRPAASIAVALSLYLRPTMALIGLWWALRRKWRVLVWAGISAAAIFVCLLSVVPIDAWFDYATMVRNMSDVGGALRNTHFAASAVLLGAPEWAAQLVLPLAYAVAVSSILLSLRRDAELSYIVTITSTLLISPLLWPHYFVQLLLPAAFLASRGRVWGIGLPLLGWLPITVLPLVALIAVLVPFLAKPLPARKEEAPEVERAAREFDSSAQLA